MFSLIQFASIEDRTYVREFQPFLQKLKFPFSYSYIAVSPRKPLKQREFYDTVYLEKLVGKHYQYPFGRVFSIIYVSQQFLIQLEKSTVREFLLSSEKIIPILISQCSWESESSPIKELDPFEHTYLAKHTMDSRQAIMRRLGLQLKDELHRLEGES